MAENGESLATALPKEQERVRKLVQIYRDPAFRGAGEFAARMMEHTLKETEEAVMPGDVVKMIQCYNELKEYAE